MHFYEMYCNQTNQQIWIWRKFLQKSSNIILCGLIRLQKDLNFIIEIEKKMRCDGIHGRFAQII